MQTTSVSRSYAKVLFDLASKANQVDAVKCDIQALGLLCNKMHKLFFSIDKQASVDKKKDFLETIISHGKLSKVTVKFLQLLRLENKFSLLYDIFRSFMDLDMRDKNIVVVNVKSVEIMDKKSTDELSKVMSELLNKEIQIDNIVDPSIMGGVVIEIGSYVIDNSFVNRLRRIKLATNDI